MKPKISIILPVYNSEKYIEDTIKSVLNQTLKEFELIIVDDGSSDNSYKICNKLALLDNRIKLFRKMNGGISDARNFGLTKAKSDYISFLDHDDLISPNLLEENYILAVKYKADIVKYGREYIYIKNSEILRSSVNKRDFKIYHGPFTTQQYLKMRYNNTLELVWDGLYKRSIILENNITFDSFFKSGGEDIDFCSKYILKSNTLITNPHIYYKHFIRKGFSTSTKPSENVLSMAKERAIRLYHDIKTWDSNSKELFTACFVKECLALIVKTFFELSPEEKDFKKKLMLTLNEIKKAPYFYIIQDVKSLKGIDYNLQNIYYRILFTFYKRNKVNLIYLLTKWRYYYRKSM